MLRNTCSINQRSRGITLIEAVIGVGLFLGISMGLFSTFLRITAVLRLSQEKIIAVSLANEQFEIIRNLPYAGVGTVGGLPPGLVTPVQTLVRGGLTFIATTTVRSVDHPFDGTALLGTDSSPTDNKFVEVEITCVSCASYRPIILSTIIGPNGLETASGNGSILLNVLNKAGQPVADADVHIVNTTLSIIEDEVTNMSGVMMLVDAPPAFQSYEISVSKPGYSTDRTRSTPVTPLVPHVTVSVGGISSVTLFIDHVSTLNVSSVTPTCVSSPNVGFELIGEKKLSDNPTDVFKYLEWFSTGGAGLKVLNDMEYDTYSIVASSTTHDLAGVIPLSPFVINPGATHNIQLVMAPKSGNALLTTVFEQVSGLPITGAEVTLTKQPAGTPMMQMTGRGFIKQTDWSGGSGQDEFSDVAQYKTQSGDLDTSVPGVARLMDVLGEYYDGWLESSIFDTGAPSNFYQFNFSPTVQNPDVGGAPILFQISTGLATTSMGAWKGFDGTSSTYYSSTSTDIHAASHDGDRYLKYKMFMTTSSSTLTPSVSEVMFTSAAACNPPGQVLFQDLTNGTYDLSISKAGFVIFTDTVTVDATTPWQEKKAPLVPI